MTRNIRLGAITTMAAAFCLATLALMASNEAAAQRWGRSPGMFNTNYGGYAYGNPAYAYPSYSYPAYAYPSYGYGNQGYTGYGMGPYGYGSTTVYSYPSSTVYTYPSSSGYGYGNSGSYNLYYRPVPYNDGTYRRMYIPGNAGFYSPYGNGG